MALHTRPLLHTSTDTPMTLLPAKRWNLLPPAPAQLLGALPEHPLLVHALYHRGGLTEADCRAFLIESAVLRNDPFHLHDMEIATERIVRAIESGEIICVYGDFDADGVTATALLVTALQAAGGKVGPYIPDRVDEGYGLKDDAIERIARKSSLIVTVDCGIRSMTEALRARELGVDLIITDHHTLGMELPQALAVINPQRGEGPDAFRRLAGVGVAYRLAQAVLRRVAARALGSLGAERAAEIEEELLDLVALGTVADMMPLLGENRDLVRRGLARLNHRPRPGIAALLDQAGVRGAISTGTISFQLAPRINAAGRLAHANLAYALLRTNDPAEARRLAVELEGLNSKRKALLLRAQADAEAQIAAGGGLLPLLLVKSRDFHPGIVGLVAGKINETYYRPAVVIEEGDVESRGSARSIRELDISAALDELAPMLVRHGGHERAAGFTVRTEILPAFAEALGALAQAALAPHSDLRPTLDIDADVPLREINWGLLEQFARLEPYGQDNAMPLLMSRNLRVREARAVGNGKTLKLVVDGGPHQPVYDCVSFQLGAHAAHLREGTWIDAVYSVEVNEYNGRRILQLNIRDLRSAVSDPIAP